MAAVAMAVQPRRIQRSLLNSPMPNKVLNIIFTSLRRSDDQNSTVCVSWYVVLSVWCVEQNLEMMAVAITIQSWEDNF
jgi:hypothetical protein